MSLLMWKRRTTPSFSLAWVAFAIGTAFAATTTHGQVVRDGTLGPSKTVQPSGPNYLITPAMGVENGPNLFHSFQTFSLSQTSSAGPESAYFQGGSGIQNILARVTGGAPSDVDGKLGSDANLYFMNPSGIVFGQHAVLDVKGSFHATTADYIKLGTQGTFEAEPARLGVLSSAPPQAFGFLSGSASGTSKISIQGSDLEVSGRGGAGPPPRLSFVGGAVEVDADPNASTVLRSNGGAINLVGTAGQAQEVPVNEPLTPDLKSSAVPSAVPGPGPGTIFVSGGQLTMQGSSLSSTTADNPGGPIDVAIGGPIVMSDGASITTASTGMGNGGDVHLAAGSLTMTGGSQIGTTASGTGPGGNAQLNASNLMVTGGSSITTASTGAGISGGLSITTDQLTMTGDSRIANSNSFQAGQQETTVNVTVKGAAVLDSGSGISTTNNTTNNRIANLQVDAGALSVNGGASISSDTEGMGVGDMLISVGSLVVQDSGQIQVAAGLHGVNAGSSVKLTINARDSIVISGKGSTINDQLNACCGSVDLNVMAPTAAMQIANGGTIGVSEDTDGANPPSLTLTVKQLTVDHGSIQLSASNVTEPGEIAINASNGVTMLDGTIEPSIFRNEALRPTVIVKNSAISIVAPVIQISGGAITSAAPSGGINVQGGDITFSAADRVELGDGAIVSSDDSTEGNFGKGTLNRAGNISISAGQLVLLSGHGADGTPTTVSVNVAGPGVQAGGGTIQLSAPAIVIRDGAEVESNTQSGAGAISIGGADTVTVNLQNGSILANATGLGTGGDVNLRGSEVLMNGASVSAQSDGGPAGHIEIDAADTLQMLNSSITTDSGVSSGGSIAINGDSIQTTSSGRLEAVRRLDQVPGSLVYLQNSQISADAALGNGNGGNVLIDPTFVVLGNNSTITANANGGNGGNILIVADAIFSDQPIDTLLHAASESKKGINGNVQVNSPEVNIAGSITTLPTNFLNAAALLRERCTARRSPEASGSFVVSGHEGFSPSPDNFLASSSTSGVSTQTSAADPPVGIVLGKNESGQRVALLVSCPHQVN